MAGAHPKVQARRLEVTQSDERRKWRRTLLIVALLAAAAIVLGLARSPVLDVDTVTVQTGDRVDEEIVIELAGVRLGAQLIDVDPAAVEERVGRHPWVATVEVRREWPSTVRIDIVEAEPVAASPVGAGWRLIDLDGQVLGISPVAPVGLPVVLADEVHAAPGERADELVAAVIVADALTSDLGAWVDAVVADADGEVQLQLVGGVIVDLGTTDQLPDKLVALATLLTRVQPECIVSFDVTAPDAPVATRCPTAVEVPTDV